MTDLPSVSTDPAATRPELAALRAAVQRGDWAAVSGFLAGLTDPDDHSFAVRFAGAVPGAETFLREVVAGHPGATLPMTLLAAHLNELGWTARSAYSSSQVSVAQFRAFHGYLRQAEPLLVEVTAREPENVSAWTLRLHTARGLELGQSEARRRFDRSARYAQHSLGTSTQLLQQLCPKWGGSWEDAHAFAWERTLAAPEGAPSGALVAAMHVERWVNAPRENRLHQYFQRPAVHAELVEAAGRSVDHPAFRRAGYRAAYALNMFAMTMSLCGDHSSAARHFRAIGAEATEQPWMYAPYGLHSFRKFRSTALRKG
ncbi:hypothetical protein [Longispora urticae]